MKDKLELGQIRPLEKSPLLDLAMHVANTAPHIAAAAGAEAVEHGSKGAEIAHHIKTMAEGGSIALAAHQLVHHAVKAISHHMGKSPDSSVAVRGQEGSAVVGHHYHVSSPKGSGKYKATFSSEHGVRLSHAPEKGESPKGFHSLSHEQFKSGIKSGRIKDAEAGSGKSHLWFNKSEDEIIIEHLADKDIVLKSDDGIVLEKSEVLDLATSVAHMAPHVLAQAKHYGAEVVHHAVAVGGATAALGAAGGVVSGVRASGRKLFGKQPLHVTSHNVEGSAKSGSHYMIGKKVYKAAHSDHEGVHFDPAAPHGAKSYSPVGMTHKEVTAHLRSGHMVDLSHIGGSTHKSEGADENTLEKSDALFASQVYVITPGDTFTDINSQTMTVKGAERGVVTIVKSNGYESCLSEGDALRLITHPGNVIRRDGRKILAAR